MMKKMVSNTLPQLRMEDMKRKNLLATNKHGAVTWHHPFTGLNIDFKIDCVSVMKNGEGIFRIDSLFYWESGWTSTKKIEKLISLKSTPCRFGGRRMWFVCPKCKTQAGVLFYHNARIACRKCHNLSYRSQNTRHRMTTIGKLEKLRAAVGRSYYRGKRTKTYLRYLRKREQTMGSMDAIAGAFSKRIDKIKP